MECELGDLWNGVSAFKQAAGRFVPQVMKCQIDNAEHVARPGESRADTLRLVRKDQLAGSRLPCCDVPGFGCVLETPVVAGLSEGMLRVPDQTGVMVRIIVTPSQPDDLGLPTPGMNSKPQDIRHGNLGSLIPPPEILGELVQLLRGGASMSPPGSTNQVELVAYHSRLIDDAGVDPSALAAVSGGAKHAADPRQIIAGRGSSRTLGTPAAYVIDEDGRTQGTCVDLSDGVSFQIFERGLFGAAPRCEGTERVDVPTDQRCDGGAAGGSCVDGGRWIIEGVLPSFCPVFSFGARAESLRFLIALRQVPATPDDGLKTGASGTDSLAYGCHGLPSK
jgi:hypothetical protein